MNRLVMTVLSLIMLSGCQAIWDAIDEQHKLLHPEPVLADPFGPPCDEQCRADLRAAVEEDRKKIQYRVPQPDDPYEYRVQINGKTVTCRPGLNTGFMDGINHNVECKWIKLIRNFNSKNFNQITLELLNLRTNKHDLDDLIINVYHYLSETVLQDNQLVDFTPKTSAPILTLAYDKYTDALRADEIVRRSSIINPLFTPVKALKLSQD